MHEKLGLRLRISLFFAALALGGVALFVGGLWFGANRYGTSLDGYVIAGITGALGLIGLAAWVALLFDENVARPIMALAADLHTRAQADIGGKEIDERPARYLGALAPAANAINIALEEARTAQARAIERETEQLQREKHLFEALVRDLAEGVVVTTPDNRVMLYNRTAQDLLPGLGLDRKLSSVLRSEPVTQALDRLAMRRRRGEAGAEGFLAASRDGIRFLLGQITPITATGTPEGHVIILRDATSDLKAHADRDDLFAELMEGVRRPASAIGATLEVLAAAPDLDSTARTALAVAQREELGRLYDCLRDTESRYEAVATRHWPMIRIAANDLLNALSAGSTAAMKVHPSDDWLLCDPFAVAAIYSTLIGHVSGDKKRSNFNLRADLDGTGLRLTLSWTGPMVLDGDLQDWLDAPLSEGYGRYTGRDALRAHRSDIWAETENGTARLVLPLQATAAETNPAPAPWSDFYDFDLPTAVVAGAMADVPLDQLPFVVFDTETTGLTPRQGDRIVQIAGVRIVNGRVRRSEIFDTLVDPERPIPPASTLVHRITDAMVQGAPDIGTAGWRFHDFCEGAVLVAHNAPFDMAFLKAQETRISRTFDHPVLCTVLLSSVLFDQSADHSLDGLTARLGIEIPPEARHSALGDAVATADVFAHLIGLLQAAGVSTLQDAIDASNQQTKLRRAQAY